MHAARHATPSLTDSIASTLARLPVFDKVAHSVLRALAEDANVVRLTARKHLFYMHDAAHYFYLVASGTLNLYRPSYTGEHKIFRTLEDGDLLVETAMFLDPPEYPLSAYAVVDTRCYRLPRANLLRACRESPEFSLGMLEGMATRIAQSLNRIDLLTVGNAAQRLALYLLDVHQQQGTAWLRLPSSQVVLSRQLNITPETLSRLLGSFRRAGLVGETAGRREHNAQHMQIVLLDIPGLCREVGLPAPDPKPARPTAPRHLGSSLFDCCNYARMALGRAAG